MESHIKIKKISFLVAAGIGIACLFLAIFVNEFLLPGRGKVVFLASFVLAVTIYMHEGLFQEARLSAAMMVLVLIHAILILIFPSDSEYPGALLAPLGIADVVFCHFLLKIASKSS